MVSGNVKKDIADAYERLACRIDPDKISVKMLVEECGISRQAFYYHFQDLIDVMFYIVDRDMESNISLCLQAADFPTSLIMFLNGILSYLPSMKKGLNSKYRADIESLMIRKTRQYMSVLLDEKSYGRFHSREEKDFFVEALSCCIIGYIIQNENEVSPDIGCFCRGLERMVRKHVD